MIVLGCSRPCRYSKNAGLPARITHLNVACRDSRATGVARPDFSLENNIHRASVHGPHSLPIEAYKQVTTSSGRRGPCDGAISTPRIPCLLFPKHYEMLPVPSHNWRETMDTGLLFVGSPSGACRSSISHDRLTQMDSRREIIYSGVGGCSQYSFAIDSIFSPYTGIGPISLLETRPR